MTICTKGRVCLFGEVVDGVMRLNEAGAIVHDAWAELPSHCPDVQIDEFVVMPNHVHGIVVLSGRDRDDERGVGAQFIAPSIDTGANPPEGATTEGAINRAPTLGTVVRGFKARITNSINGIRQTPSTPVWQRNYYEHIIRGDERGVGAQFIAPPIGTDANPPEGATTMGATTEGAINRAPTLGAVVRGFKARVTAAVNGIRQTPSTPVWQRNYYEQIIRNDERGVGAQIIAPSIDTGAGSKGAIHCAPN